MNSLKRLRSDHWAWIHAKLALITWGIFYVIFTPEGPLDELGKTLNVFIATFAIIGSIIGISGLIRSTNTNRSIRRQGLVIELSGLILAFCGPFTYFIIQAYLSPDNEARIALSCFAYSFSMFILARIIVVLRAIGRHE